MAGNASSSHAEARKDHAQAPGELQSSLADALRIQGEVPMTDQERTGYYQPSDRSSVGIAITFLFIGLGAGALAALLFAPKTGKQIRRELRRKYENAKDVIGDWQEQAGDVIEKGSDWASSAKDWANTAKETAKEKVAPFAKAVKR
ncbi:MAG: YtxH domain-containing protein [Terriglobales bacterium]